MSWSLATTCSVSCSHPRHLAPQPKAPITSPRAGVEGVVDSLLFAQHAIEMFCRSLPDGPPRHRLGQLSNRLTKILSETRKLNPAGSRAEIGRIRASPPKWIISRGCRFPRTHFEDHDAVEHQTRYA